VVDGADAGDDFAVVAGVAGTEAGLAPDVMALPVVVAVVDGMTGAGVTGAGAIGVGVGVAGMVGKYLLKTASCSSPFPASRVY